MGEDHGRDPTTVGESGTSADDVQFITLHGKRRAFVKKGSGPALVLLHGLACDHTTWDPVIDLLAERYTVIAPDLLGHGDDPGDQCLVLQCRR